MLGGIFGTRAPQVLKDISPNKPTITLKKHGAAIKMLSFNEAKKLLAAERKVFESNADLEKALWNGTKLENGGMIPRFILQSERHTDKRLGLSIDSYGKTEPTTRDSRFRYARTRSRQ